jgi:hypothetical protein
MQGTIIAWILISGSLDLFSNKFFRASSSLQKSSIGEIAAAWQSLGMSNLRCGAQRGHLKAIMCSTITTGVEEEESIEP